MAKKKTSEQILATVEAALGNTVSLRDSKLSKERSTATDYYYGRLPAPTSKGNSKFVSQDVFRLVEATKADLLETFSGHTNNIQFTPMGADDVEQARIATEYCSYIFHQRNDGLAILDSVITDGLLARAGVVQVYWKEQDELIDEEYEGTADVIDMQLSEFGDDVKLEELNDAGIDLQTGEPTYKAQVVRTVDLSTTCVDPVAPEEFGISAYAKSIKAANLTFRRTEKSRSDLLKEEYDPEKVKKISFNERNLALEQERATRHDEATRTTLSADDTYDDVLETVDTYDLYIRMDVDGNGFARMWHVVYADHVILKLERVKKCPFVAFVPLPVPHAFYGQSYVEKVMPIQNARSVLIRSILDHATTTNVPRWQVTKGGLTNPKELIDNRFGGIVNVTRPDAVMPLQQAPLNPFVFQTVQLLDETGEDTTGVSKLSQGLNKDAVSKQNSAGMIDQLVSLSKQRQKIMARHFGNFMKELYLAIYECALEYETKETIIDIAGNYVPSDPQRWRERKDVKVELALGTNERETEAQKLIALHSMMASDPTLAPMYPLEKKIQTVHKVWEKMGIKDTSTYLLTAKEIKPPQPDPMMVAELELLKAQVKKMEADAQAMQFKAQADAAAKTAKSKMDGITAQANFALNADKQDLAEREFEHNKQIDAQEIALAKQAQKDGTLKALAAPDS